MALVLSRKVGESLVMTCGGQQVVVAVAHIHGDKRVSLSVQAPPEVEVWRSEIAAKKYLKQTWKPVVPEETTNGRE